MTRKGATKARWDEMPAWQRPALDWLNWLLADGTSKEGHYLREYQMRRFASEIEIGPWDVTAEHLSTWMSSHNWSRETLRSYRSALRSFYGWAHSAGLTDTDPARLLRRVPITHAKPRPAADRVIEDAMTAADDRQYLALMLGSRAGMRRAEIAKVNTVDVFRDAGGWSLLVHGKGQRERIVPLLDEIAQAIRERPPGWVFPNGKGSHITPAHLGKLMARVLVGATTHQLRHRFASTAYAATHDIRAVQELLGHASVATTQIYTHVGGDSLRSVVKAAGRSAP